MLTHDEIMQTNFVMQDEHVYCTNPDNKLLTLVFTRESVHPAFFNILRAALLLYQTSQHTSVMLEGLVELAEQAGADQLVPPLLNAGATTKVVRDAAIVGIEEIIAKTIKNDGSTH